MKCFSNIFHPITSNPTPLLHTNDDTEEKEQAKWHKPAKFFRVSCLALLYDMDEVMCKDKGHTLPLDTKLGLEVAQDVAEVYVKELDRRG